MNPVAKALAGFFLLSCGDAILKAALGNHSFEPVLFLLEVFVAIVLAIYCFAFNKRQMLRPQNNRVVLIYSLLFVLNIGAFCLLLPRVPLTELFVLVLAIPLVIMLGARVLLNEHLDMRQSVAITVGILGVFIMMQVWTLWSPQPERALGANRGWDVTAICIAVIHVTANAAQQLFTRRFAQKENAIALTFFSALVVSLVFGSLGYQQLLNFEAKEVVYVALAGIGAGFGIMLETAAFQSGKALLIAPTQYTQLLWASLFGYLFWHEVPDIWAYTGSFMLLFSGFILYGRGTSKRDAFAKTK